MNNIPSLKSRKKVDFRRKKVKVVTKLVSTQTHLAFPQAIE